MIIRMQRYRKRLGKTQSEIALEMEVSVGYVRQIEQKQPKQSHDRLKTRLADVRGVPMEELFPDAEYWQSQTEH